MEDFRQYVLSLTAAALLGGILLSCVPEGSTGKVLKLVCGILLTVTALKPLRQIRLPDLDALTGEYRQQAEAVTAMGQEMARLETREGIRNALEAYILDKAAELGMDVTPEVFLDESGIPVSVRLEGDHSSGMRQKIQTIITNDLGIPGEAQKWITRKENRP